MRIVAIADTHTHERELGSVPDGDLLIHAGDMLRQGTLDELGRFSEWLRALPHPFKSSWLATTPREIGDRTLTGRSGCDDLRSAVAARRPALHLFGHAHADGGVWHDRDFHAAQREEITNVCTRLRPMP